MVRDTNTYFSKNIILYRLCPEGDFAYGILQNEAKGFHLNYFAGGLLCNPCLFEQLRSLHSNNHLRMVLIKMNVVPISPVSEP